MKKYTVAMSLLMLFSTESYAKCCDCKDTYPIYTPRLFGTTTNVNSTKKYTGIEKLIGKIVHRTAPTDTGCRDESYMGSSRKLLAVTDKYLILTSDTSYNVLYELERDIWDDGNWEEVVKKLWTVTEITLSNKFSLTFGITDKYCVRCGGKLRYILGNNNYYCGSCKTGFNVKEE